MRGPLLLLALGALAAAPGCGSTTPKEEPALGHQALLDPNQCQGCHPDHFSEWSGSMHAYAADDPVFVAMNARGQRETKGALGPFCVTCHAPLAVQTGATTDGLNLATLAPELHGVTCYFCHSVQSVQGAHDNPLGLATDDVMRGGIADPIANGGHASAYSALHDRNDLSSAGLCGSCHDIVSPAGVALERTFAEWQGTLFSHPTTGLACGQCHMEGRDGLAANAPGAIPRRVHSHAFPAVDLALTPFPEADTQRAAAQGLLDTTLQAELCVRQLPGAYQVQVVLDNVAGGHGWPSGATQDRRAWVEVVASSGGKTVYRSGVVADGGEVVGLADPDLWLLRDCLFDAHGKQVHMFWEAASEAGYELPGPVTNVPSDPAYYLTHVYETYPRAGGIAVLPDKVTMRVRLQPIGLDVLSDLVASGDLDGGVRARMTTYTLQGTVLEWTSATATEKYSDQGVPVSCVSGGLVGGTHTARPASRSSRCKP